MFYYLQKLETLSCQNYCFGNRRKIGNFSGYQKFLESLNTVGNRSLRKMKFFVLQKSVKISDFDAAKTKFLHASIFERFLGAQIYNLGNRQKIVDFLGIPIKDWEV